MVRWRNQMEAFFALLILYEVNPSVTSGFPSQRPVTWSFDVFYDLRLNKRLSKPPKRRWFETPLRSLWRYCYRLTVPVIIQTNLTSCALNVYFSVRPKLSNQIGTNRSHGSEWAVDITSLSTVNLLVAFMTITRSYFLDNAHNTNESEPAAVKPCYCLVR